MKIIHYIIMICTISVFSSCKGQTKEPKVTVQTHQFTNELIHESSPYLLQHAHNPVNWYPWGEKAFQKAKEENKLVIISIGYAACHWCHVMEHESFEDVEVANYMNEHFICIKVDREERPDVDQVYMTASQLLTGSGGWPLNALALADGKPFYAGTYFPKNNWLKMLRYFVEIQNKNPQSLIDQAQKVTEGVKNTENISFTKEESIVTIADLNTVFNKWKSNIDFRKGGSYSVPKFPMPSNWEYLLQYHSLTKDPKALKAVTATLDNMAFGGIYDQLGGGFSRYATDANWLVPHFEKMLYDNAQLVSLYSHAYQLTKNPLYKTIVYETLAFIEKELTSPEGGFYSSLDADSDGEEGKYYVWTYEELNSVLGEDAYLFSEYYNITKSGNWEHGKNILHRKLSDTEIAVKNHLSIEKLQSIINNCKTKLVNIRSSRIKPRLDDKILTSWNGLMLKGYIDAYRAFGEEKFLKTALKNAAFLNNNTIGKTNEIQRNYKNNKATINGLLDDYAFTISAFISLYQATFDEKWLYKAKNLNDYAITHFFDSKSGMFFYTHNDYSDLIARKMEVADNVIPASNSEMAKNLFFLSLYFDNANYIQKSKQMITNVQKDIHKDIPFYSNWGIAELQLLRKPYEVAIVGDEFEKVRKAFDKNYFPNVIFLGGKNEGTLALLEEKLFKGQTTIFVCKDKVCNRPTTEIKIAIDQLNQ
ncbi:thioredoxin domain-containing protein [Flavobacterium sp. K5-23]|uniref:thioredoxin domain-containing protein n=1 Tax=Flavobacterium sp. K5-23 TaxID=2746225 RepID=UPI00200FE704|nr:thioredoxin domain-containing protein [Flavobacterium sp. K5-23]UQD56758.1 thioredoxin domain-containing protein [Flavobacterium sp. K5-23]